MKNNFMTIVIAATGLVAVAAGVAAAQTSAALASPTVPPVAATFARDDIGKQLAVVTAKVEARIEEDKTNGTRATPRAWADILRAYDAILSAHKNEKTDVVAQVALRKDLLYAGCFNLPETSIQLLAQMIKDYPDTPSAQMAATFVASFKEDAAFMASRRQLIGQPLPNFQVCDSAGQSLSSAGFQGRVVLLDYWTTDCDVRFNGMEEMPNVKKAYAKYHNQGFEILGIYVGGIDNEAERHNLAADVLAGNMPWPEYFHPPVNYAPDPLANVPQPRGYPGNYLVGRDGKIIGVDVFGDDLDAAVATAVAAK